MMRKPIIVKQKGISTKRKETDWVEFIEPLEMTLTDENSLRFGINHRIDEEGVEQFLVDFRIYTCNDKYTGYTKKGFSIPLEQFTTFEETFKMLKKDYCDKVNELAKK